VTEPSTAGLKISCTSANASGAASSEELIRYFSERLPDATVCRKQPPAGVVMADAFDWYLLLAAGADIATVLDMIYAAYEAFVKPLRSAGKKDAGFYVRIENQFRQHGTGDAEEDGVARAGDHRGTRRASHYASP
jgi:hypothetical protein